MSDDGGADGEEESSLRHLQISERECPEADDEHHVSFYIIHFVWIIKCKAAFPYEVHLVFNIFKRPMAIEYPCRRMYQYQNLT